jgi:hypothetical protein
MPVNSNKTKHVAELGPDRISIMGDSALAGSMPAQPFAVQK